MEAVTWKSCKSQVGQARVKGSRGQGVKGSRVVIGCADLVPVEEGRVLVEIRAVVRRVAVGVRIHKILKLEIRGHFLAPIEALGIQVTLVI